MKTGIVNLKRGKRRLKLRKYVIIYNNKKGDTIVKERNNKLDFQEDKNGISSIYNIRSVPDFGVGKSAIRKISHVYIINVEQLKHMCVIDIVYKNQKGYREKNL